jgi:hypothetical protein
MRVPATACVLTLLRYPERLQDRTVPRFKALITLQSRRARRALLLFLVVLAPHAAADGNWETRVDTDGVTVETRDIEGSSYKAFRASIIVQATPDQVLERLQDVASYPDWFPDTVEARQVPNDSGLRANYVRTGAPWPVKDRDAVYTQRVERSKRAITIHVGVAPELVPTVKDAVRVRQASGRWHLLAVDAGTEVEWRFHLEPGGKVPSSLANTRVVDTPRRALLALRAFFEPMR